MNNVESVQAAALPVVDGIDNRHTPDTPFGYVYFKEANYEGDTVRIGYVGGLPDPDGSTPVSRECPLIFQGNWGDAGAGHFLAAWNALVEAGVAGFAQADPLFVRVSVAVGTTEVQEWSKMLLAEEAEEEFARFHRKLKGILKAAKAASKKKAKKS